LAVVGDATSRTSTDGVVSTPPSPSVKVLVVAIVVVVVVAAVVVLRVKSGTPLREGRK
jgi:hypothetical protein